MNRRVQSLLAGVILALALNITVTPALAKAASSRQDSVSLSFPSTNVGFVLSLYDCANKTCADLRDTDDAGDSWANVAVPLQLNESLHLATWGNYVGDYTELSVHFADANDGWIYGTVPAPATQNTAGLNFVNRVWSTHDGGQHWHQIHIGPLSPNGFTVQMATRGALTFLFGGTYDTGRAYIFATSSNVDHWTKKSDTPIFMPAGGTQLEGAFTFAGTNGWFVEGNDRGFASLQLNGDGEWSAMKRTSMESDDASFAPLVALSDSDLLFEGKSAGFVTPPTASVPRGWNSGASWLFISHDGGSTFTPYRQLTSSYRGSYLTVPGLPATPAAGTILLEREKGSSLQFVRSTDWGRTWQQVFAGSVSQVTFTSPTSGFAIAQTTTNLSDSVLIHSDDGGARWSPVPM